MGLDLTQEQFDNLATKDDLKEVKEGLESKIDKVTILAINNKEDIKELKEKVDKIDGNLGTIMTTLDGIVKSFKDHEEEHDTNLLAHDRFEKRISALEGKPVEAVDMVK